jgi:thymidylate synthase (FAD)
MKAELIDYMGSDLRVVDAARVSFNKASEWENESSVELLDYEPKLKESDAKLINYLAKHDHFTPFTHCMITLRETVPIFVARQRFKHTVGFTYNEVSRRYVNDEPEFYVPTEWRKKPEGSIKQGSGNTHDQNEIIKKWYSKTCTEALLDYNSLIDNGVAPEQARMFLPQGMMTSYYVTGSLSAFARAYLLRIDPHSQQEIQELAKQWDAIIKPLFPVSWEALTCN